MRVFDVIVLGAGASGLMCSWTAAERGLRVLNLEHGARAARKLAVSGGGKCNLTNRHIGPEDYVGENPDFCRSALARFSPEDLLALVGQAGIAVEEREHGQIFCRRSAGDVADFLLAQCRRHGCAFRLEEKILGLERLAKSDRQSHGGARFLVRSTTGTYPAGSVVVATGGPAFPQLGATDIGHTLARRFGHSIVPVRPALVGLKLAADSLLRGLPGLSLPVSISITRQHPARRKNPDMPAPRASRFERQPAENLPLLCTHKGISGPAVFQTSLYWQKGDVLEVDFLPGRTLSALLDAPDAGRLLCRNLLARFLPGRLCARLTPEKLGRKKVAELSRKDRDLLQNRFHAWQEQPLDTEGFSKAEVAAGGADTREFSSRDMQSARIAGLYFCGEVLDVTGRLGGYNLHWAFASGHAAGTGLLPL